MMILTSILASQLADFVGSSVGVEVFSEFCIHPAEGGAQASFLHALVSSSETGHDRGTHHKGDCIEECLVQPVLGTC